VKPYCELRHTVWLTSGIADIGGAHGLYGWQSGAFDGADNATAPAPTPTTTTSATK
jgi:hypothetical protein